MTPKSESQIQAEVLSAVGRREDARLYRASTGTAKRGDAYYKFGHKGQADLTGWVRIRGVAVRLEIEVKSEIGKLSEHQAMFLDLINREGGIGICARSAADAMAQLDRKIVYISKKMREEPLQ